MIPNNASLESGEALEARTFSFEVFSHVALSSISNCHRREFTNSSYESLRLPHSPMRFPDLARCPLLSSEQTTKISPQYTARSNLTNTHSTQHAQQVHRLPSRLHPRLSRLPHLRLPRQPVHPLRPEPTEEIEGNESRTAVSDLTVVTNSLLHRAMRSSRQTRTHDETTEYVSPVTATKRGPGPQRREMENQCQFHDKLAKTHLVPVVPKQRTGHHRVLPDQAMSTVAEDSINSHLMGAMRHYYKIKQHCEGAYTVSETVIRCNSIGFMRMSIRSTRHTAFRRKMPNSEGRILGPYIPLK